MKTIFLIPSSPFVSQGARTFPFDQLRASERLSLPNVLSLSKRPPPSQTTHVTLSTLAPVFLKAARPLPAHARKDSARDFPTIPVDCSHSFIVFALMFVAAAVTIFLSALAILDLVAR